MMMSVSVQISEYRDIGKSIARGDSSSVELLLIFQRLLLGNIYFHSSPSVLHPPSTHGDGKKVQTSQHIQGGIAVLVRYMTLLHHHVLQVLPMASQLISLNQHHFEVASQILKEGPVEVLLPELAVGLVLLHLKLPQQLMESRCVPLLRELVECLDNFNRLAPGALQEDEEDLTWPDTYSNNNNK